MAHAQRKHLRFEHLTEEDGLSNYYVYDILTDRHGFLWVATSNGLNRYDGYQFQSWHAMRDQPHALASGDVKTLLLDSRNQFWVGTTNGLHLFDETTQRFERIPGDHGEAATAGSSIETLFEDAAGHIWVGTSEGLSRTDGLKPRRFTHWTTEQVTNHFKGREVFAITEDKAHHIWVGTGNGLYRYSPDHNQFVYFQIALPGDREWGFRVNSLLPAHDGGLWVGTTLGLRRLSPDDGSLQVPAPELAAPLTQNITDLLYDDAGRLWVSTAFDGLYLQEAPDTRFQNYRRNPGDLHSLLGNQLTTLHADTSGYLWVGTMSPGLSYFDPRHLDMGQYRHVPEDPETLPNEMVWAFYAPDDDHIWLGTNEGLVLWDRTAGTFRQWMPAPEDPKDLSRNRVRAVLPREGGLIVGLRRGLATFSPDTGTFTQLLPTDSKRAITTVRCLLRDHEGIVWAGSYGAGLYRVDEQAGTVTNFTRKDGQVRFSLQIRSLLESDNGTLWVGTHDGLTMIPPDRRGMTSFFTEKDVLPNSNRNRIMALHKARGEALWLGLHGAGLAYFDHEMGELRYYTEEDGLPSGMVYGMLKGSGDLLWLTTEAGLVRFDTAAETFVRFDYTDGLHGRDHNSGAYTLTPGGKLLIAGPNGINLLEERVLGIERTPPEAFLTRFSVNGIEVGPAMNDAGAPLQEPIFSARQIHLNHRHQVFTLHFALRSQVYPEQQHFAYKLEGFDRGWTITPPGIHTATYTNLSSGTYSFRVKNARATDEAAGQTLRIHIRPAPWRSPLAYLAYVLLVLLAGWRFIAGQQRKLRNERRVVERLKRLDKMRDDFLANTSHELRTPLNGIIGLAESLKDNPARPLPRETGESLGLIVSIGKRLAALVNDILDFSQLKNQGISLSLREVNLHVIVDTVLTLSKATLGDKPLTLENHVPPGTTVSADEDRLMQILHNLVSNAVKFTPTGHVRVEAETHQDAVMLHVRDTGIGIAPDKLETIFQQFRQADEDTARRFGGTGLGLAITRELVHLHHGKIWVSSAPDRGSTFSISLPKGEEHAGLDMVSTVVDSPETGDLDPEAGEHVAEHIQIESPLESGRHFRILVVDDEPINCTVLHNHLADYQVTSAFDGASCLRLLEKERHFDLVLLDVMMPRMSGYEVCRKIRELYSHFELPVIFLSARNRVADLTVGFDSGANDYITKPISKGELLSRVRTHLSLLDTHRNLEERIARRTEELEKKNKEIIRTQNKLIMQEKMAYLGSLTSGIAHEIRNPLNFVHGLALASTEQFEELEEEVRKREQPEADGELTELVADLKKNMAVILKHGRRAAGIVESMMDLSRDSGGTKAAHDVTHLLEAQVRLVHKSFQREGMQMSVTLETEWDPHTPEVECKARQLGRVFVNLTRNAFEGMSARHAVDPDYAPVLRLWTRFLQDRVLIGIMDNGQGIQPDLMKSVFDPFFTTRPPDSNHIGLGLSVCYDIVVGEHGGELQLKSEPDQYTKAIIILPLKPEPLPDNEAATDAK